MRLLADPKGTVVRFEGRRVDDIHLSADQIERGVALDLEDRVALLLHFTPPNPERSESVFGIHGVPRGRAPHSTRR
jgi:hypothetical protein